VRTKSKETSRAGKIGYWRRAEEGEQRLSTNLESDADRMEICRTMTMLFLLGSVLELKLAGARCDSSHEMGAIPLPCSKAMWEADTSEKWELEYKNYLSRRKGQGMLKFCHLRELGPRKTDGVDEGLVEDLVRWAEEVDELGTVLLARLVGA
jgi:hypothetical protein